MRMKVVDQLHLSALGPDTMGKGHEFEVSEEIGKQLEKQGLATPVDSPAPAPADEKADTAKAEKPPANKKEQPPANKASTKRGKRTRR